MTSAIRKLVAMASIPHTLALAACATTGRGVALTACLSDPPTQSMLCKRTPSKDIYLPYCKVDQDMPNECDLPWDKSGDMVCMPKEDYGDLIAGYRRCK